MSNSAFNRMTYEVIGKMSGARSAEELATFLLYLTKKLYVVRKAVLMTIWRVAFRLMFSSGEETLEELKVSLGFFLIVGLWCKA